MCTDASSLPAAAAWLVRVRAGAYAAALTRTHIPPAHAHPGWLVGGWGRCFYLGVVSRKRLLPHRIGDAGHQHPSRPAGHARGQLSAPTSPAPRLRLSRRATYFSAVRAEARGMGTAGSPERHHRFDAHPRGQLQWREDGRGVGRVQWGECERRAAQLAARALLGHLRVTSGLRQSRLVLPAGMGFAPASERLPTPTNRSPGERPSRRLEWRIHSTNEPCGQRTEGDARVVRVETTPVRPDTSIDSRDIPPRYPTCYPPCGGSGGWRSTPGVW